MNKLFLARCFKQFKLLFFIIMILIIGVCYVHKTHVEITPFFIFGAYSSKTNVKKDSFFIIKINDEKILNLTRTYDEPRRMMIFSTLVLYHNGAKNNFIDPIKIASQQIIDKHPFLSFLQKFSYCEKERYLAYLPWLKKYMQKSVDSKISSIKIYQHYIHYNDQNLPVPDSTILKYFID